MKSSPFHRPYWNVYPLHRLFSSALNHVRQPRTQGSNLACWATAWLLAAWLAGGCASTDEPPPHHSGGFDGSQAALPPAFLSGAVAVILTNTTGFSAQITQSSGVTANVEEPTIGDLLVCGPRLLFAPTRGPALEKPLKDAGLRYMWNADQNRGWILSERLQGCAPVCAAIQITNVNVSAAVAAVDKIDGHPCQQQDVTITLSNGLTAVYRVWRATDLGNLPVQVVSLGGTKPLSLKLSKCRPTTPPAELFEPPDGFTHFKNPEALVTELFLRQQNLKSKSRQDRGDLPLDDQRPVGVR